MKDYFLRFFRCCMVLTLMLTLRVGAASSESFNHSLVRLSGHVPSAAMSGATFLKTLDADSHVSVTFMLPVRNQEELEKLVNSIYDPTDEQNYRKYLTPKDFAERFAPTEEDYNTVIAYAKSLGLIVTGTHANRTLLNVEGSTKAVETAFNLRLYQYQKSDGRTFYAPNIDPEVPAAVASIIHGIVGLDNHAVWRTYNRRQETTDVSPISNEAPNAHPSGPGGGYSPNDLLIAYDLSGVAANGSGQIVALFELAAYNASDINVYTNQFGLPTAKLQNILVDGGAGTGINAEVTLDIELVLALAPESQVLVYEGPNSGQGVLDTYNRIATDNIAKQVSTSWGLGEDRENTQVLQAEHTIFLQMAAQGQTIYAAAGDSGAFDDFPSQTLVVDDPASQPKVVGVGGTRLTVDSGSGAYGSEQVWNNGLGKGAGGGGVSGVWPRPKWQKHVHGLASKSHRNVPDVSLNSDPATGYSIFHGGRWLIFGGTSCAAPLWAGFTARVNQQRVANQMPVLGFANPTFYAIGIGSAYTQNFHDITTGDNLHYSAQMGYDNATGWGSFIGSGLFNSLTSPSAP